MNKKQFNIERDFLLRDITNSVSKKLAERGFDFSTYFSSIIESILKCSNERTDEFFIDCGRIFKVSFSYMESNSSGGLAEKKEEVRLYDASNAKELQDKIDIFMSDDRCGYRKCIRVTDIIVL